MKFLLNCVHGIESTVLSCTKYYFFPNDTAEEKLFHWEQYCGFSVYLDRISLVRPYNNPCSVNITYNNSYTLKTISRLIKTRFRRHGIN